MSRPADPMPIVESSHGIRDFLVWTPRQTPRLAATGEPVGDVAEWSRLLEMQRHDEDEWGQYERGRLANTVAAVRICNGGWATLDAAAEAIAEAEATFCDMLASGNTYPEPLTWAALGMVRYNAAVCRVVSRNRNTWPSVGIVDEGAAEDIEMWRRQGLAALDEVKNPDTQCAFVRNALEALATA